MVVLQINMNIDVRLIQVNERLSRHKLLVGVADWVQNCTGSLQVGSVNLHRKAAQSERAFCVKPFYHSPFLAIEVTSKCLFVVV